MYGKRILLVGVVLFLLGAPARAQEVTLLDSLHQRREAYAASGDSLRLARTGRSIANLHLRRGDLPRALDLYLRGLAVFQSLNRKEDLAGNLHNIGMVHWLQDNAHLALDYFSRSLALERELGDEAGIASALNSLANLLLEQQAYDEALSYYKQALALHEAQEEVAGAAMVHHNIGVVLIAQRQYPKALDHLFQALDLKESARDRTRIFPTYEEVAHAYLEMEAYEKALRYAQKSLALAETNGDLRPLMASTQTLAEIYAAMGDHRRAYAYQNRYIAARDSLLTVEKAQAIARLQTRYETQQKEQALENLRQESRLQALQAQTTRNMLLGGLGAVLLLAGLLYNRSRLKQKANRLLTAQKEEISRKSEKIRQKKEALQQSLTEKELLVKEIHHRVKNNLQVISSLLSVQSYLLTDGKALEAVQDIHHRVEAMALVHKKLYRTENLAEIDAQEYLEDLSRFLLRAFQGKAEHVRCRVRAEGIKLDMDAAVPLGLIAGELIANALEHAFPGDRRGEIVVDLQKSAGDAYAFRIADDGIGLPPAGGDGDPSAMGLSLVEKLTRQLNGTMHVTNGLGTTFTIAFNEETAP